MPIFEYKCTKCGKVSEFFERQQSAYSHNRRCPNCGSTAMEKQISTFSALIKQGSSKRCLSCSDKKCPHASDGIQL